MRRYFDMQTEKDLWIQDIVCFRMFMFVMKRNALPHWCQLRADEARAINFKDLI